MKLKDWYNKTFKNSKIENNRNTYLIGQQSIYTPWGTTIYASDFVNNCIDRVASELSKLQIKSVIDSDGVIVVKDDITRLFRNAPNEYQTTSDFLSSCEWLRKKYGNCFIYPKYNWIFTGQGNWIKRFTAFYPLNPTNFEVGIGENYIEIKFNFADGSQFTLPYSELIHLKWRRGNNMVLGGNDYGQSDENNLYKSVDALHKTIEGLPKAIEASTQIKGVFASKTVIGAEEILKERDNFETHIATSKSGIVATDMAGEFTPVKIDFAKIEPETMKFLKSNVCDRYGVSLPILSGNYTAEQHSAFFQTGLEDFINQFEQAFTNMCYTAREKDIGHKVRCYYNKLQRIGTTDATNIATLATNTGLMTMDEIRDMYGMEPLEDGKGKERKQSLNFINADKADQYQVKEDGDDGEE